MGSIAGNEAWMDTYRQLASDVSFPITVEIVSA
jgi:hypothetical protein